MDRRGRELFEVGHNRTSRWEAHSAGPATPHEYPHENLTSAPKRRFWKPRRSRLLLAALGLGLLLGAAEEAVRNARHAPELERFARAIGFGIDQVSLKGHRFSYDRDVFDALDLANVRTFAALDTAATKARIERLPWIDTAEITRVYPGRLEIRVSERQPFALWSRADNLYLIDKTGRVLAAVNGETMPNLPRFAGEGAAAEAASFLETVGRYPEVATHLTEVERVSQRRWRLKLHNRAVIELPADGEVGALENLSRDADLMQRVGAGQVTLDFRGPGRVAIRSESDTSAAAANPNTGS